MNIFKRLHLLSVVIIPFQTPDGFLDLHYRKLKPNKVTLNNKVTLSVDNSASPLFYKLKDITSYKAIKIRGKIQIKKPLMSEKDDSYFQLGVVYKGSYRPNFIVRSILPEWLVKILNINKKYGVGYVDFFHVTNSNFDLNKKDTIRDIHLSFKTVASLDKKGEFVLETALRDKEILGLWLRADGDDHQGVFNTTISQLELIK